MHQHRHAYQSGRIRQVGAEEQPHIIHHASGPRESAATERHFRRYSRFRRTGDRDLRTAGA